MHFLSGPGTHLRPVDDWKQNLLAHQLTIKPRGVQRQTFGPLEASTGRRFQTRQRAG